MEETVQFGTCFVRKIARKNSEGKVYKRFWQGVLKYKDGDSWKQKTRAFGPEVKTKTDANDALAAWKAEVRRANRAKDGTLTVAEYIDVYIDACAKKGRQQSTVDCYRRDRNRINDGFGSTRLIDLDYKTVEEWKNGLLAQGLSPYTVKHMYALLRATCKEAVKRGDLDRNPCEGVSAPGTSTSAKTRNALSDESLDALMLYLDGADATPFATAVRIALRCGMREGEVCGLRWRDVDLANGVIHVAHAIGRTSHETYVKEPKNRESVRYVTITPALRAELLSRKAAIESDLLDAGIRPNQRGYKAKFDGLYVLGNVHGDYYSPCLLGRDWHRFADEHDIQDMEGNRAVFHDLRHTYATLALASGVDIAGISANLGHSQISTTLNMYSNATRQSKAAAQDAVDVALRGHAPAEVVTFKTGTEG